MKIIELKDILVYRQSTDPEKDVFEVKEYKDLNDGKNVPVIHNFNVAEKKLGYAKLKFTNDEVYADLHVFDHINASLNPAIGFMSSGKILSIGLCMLNNTDKSILSLRDQLYKKS